MPVNHRWEWIREELQVLSRQNNLTKDSVCEFESGDIAYHEGSLHEVFTEFLKRKGYQLTPLEKTSMPKKGRYCIVIQRLSQDTHIVCYCASYGGAKGFHDVKDPVARHFGIPLNENTTWPGVSPLQTSPPWKSQHGAYIFAIPMVCEGLLRTNIPGPKIRLLPNDFQRLRRIIIDRSQSFDRYADELRAGYAQWRLMGLTAPLMHQERLSTKVVTDQQLLRPFNHPIRISLPNQSDVSWLLKGIQSGIFGRYMCLESLKVRKRPLLTRLPMPFFASTLRFELRNTIRYRMERWERRRSCRDSYYSAKLVVIYTNRVATLQWMFQCLE